MKPRCIIRPNTITLNSGISSCRNCWSQALSLAARQCQRHKGTKAAALDQRALEVKSAAEPLPSFRLPGKGPRPQRRKETSSVTLPPSPAVSGGASLRPGRCPVVTFLRVSELSILQWLRWSQALVLLQAVSKMSLRRDAARLFFRMCSPSRLVRCEGSVLLIGSQCL